MSVPKSVAIIDYGSGNLRSAEKAFQRADADAGLGLGVCITRNPEDLKNASHIVLPGVGAFVDCLSGIKALPGMMEALQENVIDAGKPFLGICVGMQLMADVGREHETTDGFGWIPGEVRALQPNDKTLKIPHMGWNELQISGKDTGGAHPVFGGINEGAHVYFVHSFGFRPKNPGHVLATVDYGGETMAAIGRDNMVGVQFHPEKSQAVGLKLIANFLRWKP